MDTILFPIKWVIGWIMYGVHWALVQIGLPDGAGVTWILSIVGLTLVVRILIIPLYSKQIRSQRAMQELNPEIQKLQKKYKGKTDPVSQQRQQEELTALYKDHGSSPFASCMPLLIQMPIFLSLFRLLYAILPLSEGTYSRDSIGPIDQEIAGEIAHSTVWGAPVTSSIATREDFSDPTRVVIVAAILILLLMATLFFSQRQLMTKNMPESSMDPSNPAAKMQKYMLYGMPLLYLFTGFSFQVGVLVYWVTGNLWNIGQQTWMMTFNPTPGSAAYKKREERLRKKRIAKGLPPEEEEEQANHQIGQREQPLGKQRSKKAHNKAASPSATSADQEAEETTGETVDDDVVRGPDGLTDEERAQKRYERRQAERDRSKAKKKAKAKRQQNRGKGNS